MGFAPTPGSPLDQCRSSDVRVGGIKLEPAAPRGKVLCRARQAHLFWVLEVVPIGAAFMEGVHRG